MEILVQNEDIDGALRDLKLMIARDGILAEIRRREMAPNLTNRRKMKDLIAARRRVKREQRKETRQHGHRAGSLRP